MQPRYADAPPRRRTDRSADMVASGLGWFSIALGTLELVAPGALARCLGMERDTKLLRGYGVREIATGIGILRSDDPRPWVWGRVAGDLVDLATLGRGIGDGNARRDHVGVAIGAIAAVTLIDLFCARALDEAGRGTYVAPDFRDRSGFPKPAAEMRGAARAPKTGVKARRRDRPAEPAPGHS